LQKYNKKRTSFNNNSKKTSAECKNPAKAVENKKQICKFVANKKTSYLTNPSLASTA
jgi:hypothetical protein